MTITPGDNVGQYRIIEPLGQGGMATVYKAYHPALDRYVAIKVLHPAFKEDPNFLTRFNREARIVAKLDHPNIVPIYDFAEHQGTPYLVMRYVEGKTLKALLREGMLPIPRVLAIIHPVTDALAYAHTQGVLHRDIKPSNIIRANDGHIYLTDFGLARIAQAAESTLSQDMLIGTPQYISPEQARGALASERSDIYSLGVVLFELFTGRVPFSADTPYAVIHDHIYTALPLPTSINPNLPVEIERVLLKVLAKDPDARYATADELMTVLEQAAGISASSIATISAPPIPIVSIAPPVTMPERPTPPPETMPERPITPKPTAAPIVQKPTRKFNWKVIAAVGVIVLALILCGAFAFAAGQRSALARLLPGQPTPDSLTLAKNKVLANPQDPTAHTQLGDEYAKQGNYDDAFAEYDRSIRINPKSAAPYMHAGGLAEKQGDLNRALKYYEAGLAANPQSTELLLRQADLLLQMKRPEDAQALYEKVLRLDPDNPLANYGLGRVAKQRGNGEEARRRFNLVVSAKDAPAQLIEDAKRQLSDLAANPTPDPVALAQARVNANPQDPNAHIQLGDAYAIVKNFDAAFAEYDAAIKLDPKSPHAYAQAGELATSRADFERASKYYQTGRNGTPEDMELLLGQGDLFFKWKKYDDARTTYEKALRLDSNNPQAIWRLANTQRVQGQLVEALRNYTRALAIDPNLPEAHFGMGMLAMERGAKDEARRQFQIVVNNPNSPPDLKDQASQQLNLLGDK